VESADDDGIVDALPFAVEQLTWSFVDMTTAGGKVALMWLTRL